MAEESQTPGYDRLGDRRLNSAGANYLVGDVRGEGNLQNMSKAPLIERITSRFPDFTVTSHISEPYSRTSRT